MPTFFWLLKLEPTLVFECCICLQNNSQRQLEHSKFNANLKIFLSKTTIFTPIVIGYVVESK